LLTAQSSFTLVSQIKAFLWTRDLTIRVLPIPAAEEARTYREFGGSVMALTDCDFISGSNMDSPITPRVDP
jgi:hypothetical protein